MKMYLMELCVWCVRGMQAGMQVKDTDGFVRGACEEQLGLKAVQ